MLISHMVRILTRKQIRFIMKDRYHNILGEAEIFTVMDPEIITVMDPEISAHRRYSIRSS